MKIIKNTYIKYIIKSSFLFYTFLFVGIASFFTMTLLIKMEIIGTYNGSYSDNKVIINETVDNPLEEFYVYRSRNDRIYTFHKGEKEYLDDFTIIYVDNEYVKEELAIKVL